MLTRKATKHVSDDWTSLLARRVFGLKLRQRVGLRVVLDGAALAGGLAAGQLGRYDLQFRSLATTSFWALVALAICLLSFLGTVLHLYLGRYRFGGFEEVRGVSVAVALTTAGTLVADLALGRARPMPASAVLLGGVVALAAMFGIRYAWRLADERVRRPGPGTAEPLIVFGAGEGGARIIASMQRTPHSPYYPVAIVDDDPSTWNLQLGGVRVRGGRDAVAAVARRTGARTVLIAVPSAGAPLLREVTGLAEAAGLAVKVLPPVTDLIDGLVAVSDIRDIDLADLLGRHQIETDVGAVAGYLTGRRVLVTGAGGSIGSELCRQIHRFRPESLIMFDRDESALVAVQLSISGRSRGGAGTPVLGDIRDVDFVRAAFAEWRPHVVFHAAALKHVPLLEDAPGESVKTNVWGTLSILEAAAAVGVERFVNISTDKAANPASVLGCSKRIAERLTAQVARRASGSYVSVRFGNVLGSRGSVLTVFAAQIAAGGPVTVTHPDATRYFMTVQEAVQLVVQAGAVGASGDALVLDMGDPVRIDDVARRLAARAGRDVRIVYTGLVPGEKLSEELFGAGETDDRPGHPLISRVPVPPLDPELVARLDPWADGAEVRAALTFYGRGDDLRPAPVVPTPAVSPEDAPVAGADGASAVGRP